MKKVKKHLTCYANVQAENTKNSDGKNKTSIPEEQVENADQYKLVLNKIMTINNV